MVTLVKRELSCFQIYIINKYIHINQFKKYIYIFCLYIYIYISVCGCKCINRKKIKCFHPKWCTPLGHLNVGLLVKSKTNKINFGWYSFKYSSEKLFWTFYFKKILVNFRLSNLILDLANNAPMFMWYFSCLLLFKTLFIQRIYKI